ncbi:hypothetical protein GCM10023319_43140 [Nocardia iowensis]
MPEADTTLDHELAHADGLARGQGAKSRSGRKAVFAEVTWSVTRRRANGPSLRAFPIGRPPLSEG